MQVLTTTSGGGSGCGTKKGPRGTYIYNQGGCWDVAMGESGVMVCGVVWSVVVGGVHVGVVCMLVWCGCGVGVVWVHT